MTQHFFMSSALREVVGKQAIGIEELADGVTRVEDEICLYARMPNPDVLKLASSHERQEQYEYRVRDRFGMVKGRVRVRKTGDDKPSFAMTAKIKNPDGTENETAVEISEDFFNQAKLLAECGMLKTRYVFDVEGRPEKWEVDVFPITKQDGTADICEFVKIDFEFAENATDRSLPMLPPGFVDEVSAKSDKPEDRTFISRLYNEVILIKIDDHQADK